MPYALEIPLKRIGSLSRADGETHRALNGMVYHWLEAADKQIVNYVHNATVRLKPFTVAPLVKVNENAYAFRVTLLEDEYGAFVSEGIAEAMAQEQRGGYSIRIENEILAVTDAIRVTHCGYEEIQRSAQPHDKIGLEFITPTSFHVQGLDYPFPEPRRVFEGYARRWNEFSGWVIEPLDGLLEWIDQNLAVQEFEMRSEHHSYEKHFHIGAVGWIKYRVRKEARNDREMIRWLNCLADFALFCGTGRKTTQGMGQTRRWGARADQSLTQVSEGSEGKAREV